MARPLGKGQKKQLAIGEEAEREQKYTSFLKASGRKLGKDQLSTHTQRKPGSVDTLNRSVQTSSKLQKTELSEPGKEKILSRKRKIFPSGKTRLKETMAHLMMGGTRLITQYQARFWIVNHL